MSKYQVISGLYFLVQSNRDQFTKTIKEKNLVRKTYENKILLNHLLLIFRFYLYNARKTGNINIENLKASIYNIKNFEREISKDNPKKTMKYKKKWHLIPQVM